MNCPKCGALWNGYRCDTCDWRERLTIAQSCGGQRCRVDGEDHDLSVMRKTTHGGTLVCAKCGMTAMDIDLLEAP